MSRNLRFLVSFFLILSAALIQSTNWLDFLKIKPNLVLAILLALSFFVENFWKYLTLSFLGIAVLKFMPAIDKESLYLVILFLLVFFLNKYFIPKKTFNVLFLISFATLAFYLFSDINFILLNPPLLILELIYNNLVGLGVYFTANTFYEKTKTSQ